ncbi:MAG: amidohydrolase [Dehalococcoidia bacterium]|nr:amidohydrolase [Dehalococcoidia bacterium]
MRVGGLLSSRKIVACNNDAVRIDAHAHCFPKRFLTQRSSLLARDATFGLLYRDAKARMATAEDLVAALDAAQVDAAVVAGIGWTDRELAREANDAALEAASRYPGRLIPFCSVNPAWGDAALREMERCAKAGTRGVGELHPDTQGFRLDDIPLLTPFAGLVRRLGLVVLTHTSEPVGHQYPGKGRTTPEQVVAFAQAFPQVRLVCAHWGGGLPFYALMPELAATLRNVYVDCAASPFLYRPQVFSTVAGLLGEDRVLFGSDFPLLGYERALADLQAGGLTLKARRKVMGGNAARLLGLSPRGRRGA